MWVVREREGEEEEEENKLLLIRGVKMVGSGRTDPAQYLLSNLGPFVGSSRLARI